MDGAKGKFIVIYGINNTGKSTQGRKLVDRINNEGGKAIYLKYPIYNLEPSGQKLNDYLRNGNSANLSPFEAQVLYAQNRADFEPELKKLIDEGTTIVAEDYTGTGIAWGMGRGVSKEKLLDINKNLLREDIAFLFDGRRFTEAREKNHLNESNDKLMESVRLIHLNLAKDFGWLIINANLPIETIHNQLWKRIS